VRLSRAQRDDLLAHAREESPNECCGYMSLRDGAVSEVVRGTSKRKSPYGYELDDESLRAVNFDLEDQGYEVAVYHSHPKSEAEPSQTDINLAYYPDWLYVIVAPTKDHVRAWWIQDGKVREEEVELDD
jgi:[CysO sulfur-carrier protein]-S-L-cysteine hydrolase